MKPGLTHQSRVAAARGFHACNEDPSQPRKQRPEHIDRVPQILQPQILIRRVLIVVVVRRSSDVRADG
jgi:hypothetical protein